MRSSTPKLGMTTHLQSDWTAPESGKEVDFILHVNSVNGRRPADRTVRPVEPCYVYRTVLIRISR